MRSVLAEVTELRIGADVESPSITRLNERYAPALALAEDSAEAMSRHAVKRHRRHGVLWLATLADTTLLHDAATYHLPGMTVLYPALPATDV